MLTVKVATHKGYQEIIEGGVANLSFPNSKTRRARVQDYGRLCPTLLTSVEVYKVNSIYDIRKLKPIEYWRLFGFKDEDFRKAEAVNSNTQLYKQAGNSIVKPVLENIFKNLF